VSKAPAMPMMIDAYIGDTTHLTTEEHGAYLLLLFAMWRRDGSVPDNDKDIARIVGLTVSKWLRVRGRLSDKLICDGHTITQKNLRKIWKNTQEKIEKNKQNGMLGGRPKYNENNNEGKANGLFSVNPNESIPEPEPELLKKEDTKVSSKEKRGTRISDDWQPSQDDYNQALQLGLTTEQVDNEANKFRDYWIAKAGSGAVKLNWSATWRNWCRSAKDRSRAPSYSNTNRDQAKSGSRLDAALRALQEAKGLRASG
jgi:uncharacterized protein YdaU (DUF1376 family)